MKQFVVAIAAITFAGFSSLALADDMGKMKGAVEVAADKKEDVKADLKGKVEEVKGKVEEVKGKPEAAKSEIKAKVEAIKGAVAK
ncbi:MAG: hypothetical protein K2X00_13670 [Nitrospiraceae bacterium]|nr:hypothetical protein [Nitrospiraceae bacterium]